MPTRLNNFPTVAVIMPAYNAAAYIAEALESVFAQDYTHYEIWVVNDGSPDTVELKAAIAPYRHRIHYLEQENKGAAAARNAAIRSTNAELVALLDADDIWEPNFLSHQVGHMRKHPSLDLVYGDATFFGGPLSGRRYMQVCPSEGEPTFEALITRSCHVMIGVVAKRSALLTAGLFAESLRRCEDFELWGRMAKAGFRLGYHRKVIMKYRRSGQGKSSQPVAHLMGEVAIYQRFLDTLELSESEKQTIEDKLLRYRGDLLLLEAKSEFGEKRFKRAASKVSAANAILLDQRLALVSLLLQTCPALMYFAYTIRANLLDLKTAR